MPSQEDISPVRIVAIPDQIFAAAVRSVSHFRAGGRRTIKLRGRINSRCAAYCLVMGIAWSRKRLFGRPMDRRFHEKDRRSGEQRRLGDRRSGDERRKHSNRRATSKTQASNSLVPAQEDTNI